jgi:hypothetical protein
MESITNHIKNTAHTVHTPRDLKDRVMSSVTEARLQRTSYDNRIFVRLSPYFALKRTRSVALVGALCLVIVMSLSTLSSVSSEKSPTLALADVIIEELSTPTSYDSAIDESVSTLDDMTFYSEFLYSEDEQVSSVINYQLA